MNKLLLVTFRTRTCVSNEMELRMLGEIVRVVRPRAAVCSGSL